MESTKGTTLNKRQADKQKAKALKGTLLISHIASYS